MLFSISAQKSGSGFYFDADESAPADAFPVSNADYAAAINLNDGSSYTFSPPAGKAKFGAISITPAVALTNAQLLTQAQDTQLKILQTACQSAITSGFTSTALGASNFYGSLQTDQLNLQTMFAASQSSSPPSAYFIYCSPTPEQNPPLTQHTQAQMLQVLADLNAWRTAQQQKYASLVTQVQAAKTVTAVQSVVWS